MRYSYLTSLIFSATLAASVSAQSVKTGIDAWQRSDYATAVAVWRPLAEKGDADAQFNLGQAYRLGRGVSINLAAAQTWFERAAEKGHLDAQTTLGLMLFQNGNRTGGLRWIKLAGDGSIEVSPPESLADDLAGVIQFRKRPGLEAAMQSMAAMLSDRRPGIRASLDKILLGLACLLEETAYPRTPEQGSRLSPGADIIPEERAAAATLAGMMRRSGFGDNSVIEDWINAALEDPLPEVRAAIQEATRS